MMDSLWNHELEEVLGWSEYMCLLCLFPFVGLLLPFVLVLVFVFGLVVDGSLDAELCAREHHDVAFSVSVEEGEAIGDSEREVGALVAGLVRHDLNNLHFATGDNEDGRFPTFQLDEHEIVGLVREEDGFNLLEGDLELLRAAFVFEQVELLASNDELVLIQLHFRLEAEDAIGKDDIAVFGAQRGENLLVAFDGEVDSIGSGLARAAVPATLPSEGCFEISCTSHCNVTGVLNFRLKRKINVKL